MLLSLLKIFINCCHIVNCRFSYVWHKSHNCYDDIYRYALRMFILVEFLFLLHQNVAIIFKSYYKSSNLSYIVILWYLHIWDFFNLKYTFSGTSSPSCRGIGWFAKGQKGRNANQTPKCPSFRWGVRHRI